MLSFDDWIISLFKACGRREFIFMRLFKNIRTNIRVSNVDDFFWWWNYFEKISIFNTKMGCRWRCRSKALGKFGLLLICWEQTFTIFVFLLKCLFIFFRDRLILQSKFSAFENKYEKTFNSDNFDYDSLAKSDYVFMRWKEHFLVRKDAIMSHFSNLNEKIYQFGWILFSGSRSHDQRY